MTDKTPPIAVMPAPGSRLDALLAEFNDVQAKAGEWETRLKSLKDGIKAESMAAAADRLTSATLEEIDGQIRAAGIELTSPFLKAPLRLTFVPRWDFDVKRFKVDRPDIYVTYASLGGRWELREAKG